MPARRTTGCFSSGSTHWPKNGKLLLSGVKDVPTQAFLLADHKPLAIAATDSGVVVTLPRNAPSSIASVVTLVGGSQGRR